MFLDYLFSPSLEKNEVVSFFSWMDEHSRFFIVQKMNFMENSEQTMNTYIWSHVGLSK